MIDLRYPVGTFTPAGPPDAAQRAAWIAEIAEMPGRLRDAIAGLTPEQLDTPYRPEGWTVRQVVHHLADSHMNSYIRYKLALTEERPTIKPYDEARWAELADGRFGAVELSLGLLDALHTRWVLSFYALKPEDFDRVFVHPEIGVVSLGENLGRYAWHGRHHIAHITGLRQRMGW